VTLHAVPDLPPDDYTSEDWADHAACRGVDPDLFFPGQGEDTRRAKAICARCPVQTFCLNEALANREKFGIWGGLSERERRRIRRASTIGAIRLVAREHGTTAGYQQHRRDNTPVCDDCRYAARLYERRRYLKRNP
jgi:WhiB family redox-sensing transcriptional regulator